MTGDRRIAARAALDDLESIVGQQSPEAQLAPSPDLATGYRVVAEKLVYELARCRDVLPVAVARSLRDWLQ